MIPKYKRHALIGILGGLGLVVGGLAIAFTEIVPRITGIFPLLIGIGIYIWGCAALAKAKGYSTAIILTAFLGLLFPVVVLLALRDKNKHYRGRH